MSLRDGAAVVASPVLELMGLARPLRGLAMTKRGD